MKQILNLFFLVLLLGYSFNGNAKAKSTLSTCPTLEKQIKKIHTAGTNRITQIEKLAKQIGSNQKYIYETARKCQTSKDQSCHQWQMQLSMVQGQTVLLQGERTKLLEQQFVDLKKLQENKNIFETECRRL